MKKVIQKLIEILKNIFHKKKDKKNDGKSSPDDIYPLY